MCRSRDESCGLGSSQRREDELGASALTHVVGGKLELDNYSEDSQEKDPVERTSSNEGPRR